MKIRDRPFKDWMIDRYHAQTKDFNYRFWISNGFFSFKDEGNQQLLSIIPIWTRYRIWRELKKEMLLRVSELLDNK